MRLMCWVTMVVAACSAHAQDAVEAVLYGPTLEPVPVVLLELVGDGPDGPRVVYLDPGGVRRDVGFDQVVRLDFPVDEEDGGDTAGFRPRLATTDGQVLVGRVGEGLAPVPGRPDVLRWPDADGFRGVELLLDDLAWAVFDPGVAPPAQPPSEDVLVLPSGERLGGFVDAIHVVGVDFVIGDVGEVVTIESDRVAGLFLANPMRVDVDPGAIPGVILTTRWGSRWRGVLGRADGAVVLTAPLARPAPGAGGLPVGQPVRLGSADHRAEAWPVVARLDLPAPGRRLVSLTSLPMETISGGAYLGVPAPPRLGPDGGLALHAPVTVGFDLPAKAQRLVLTAALEIGADVPAQRHAWAGCVVVVRQGGEELARAEVDAQRPVVVINTPLSPLSRPGRLSVTVEQGVNGPVLDRVVIRGAELLIAEDPSR